MLSWIFVAVAFVLLGCAFMIWTLHVSDIAGGACALGGAASAWGAALAEAARC